MRQQSLILVAFTALLLGVFYYSWSQTFGGGLEAVSHKDGELHKPTHSNHQVFEEAQNQDFRDSPLKESPVTLEEISGIVTAEDSRASYQRLSRELIHALFQLETIDDEQRIRSRLRPIVQKFYYLKKVDSALDAVSQKRLPNSFHSPIRKLEDLWNANPTLAQTVDSLFARFDLLNHEHVPYQLRHELASN